MTKKVASILDDGRKGSVEGIIIKSDVLGGPHRCIWGRPSLGLAPLSYVMHARYYNDYTIIDYGTLLGYTNIRTK